jgi:hypothetical protein
MVGEDVVFDDVMERCRRVVRWRVTRLDRRLTSLRKELGDDGRASSFKDDHHIKPHDTTHTPQTSIQF